MTRKEIRMSSSMTIFSPDGAFRVESEVFVAGARHNWGSEVPILTNPDSRPHNLTVQIKREGGTSFQVFHDRLDESVLTDGDPDQCAEVAVWVLSLLSGQLSGRLWMTDQGFTGHIDLVPGMTVADVRDGWISHADHAPEI
ncbi:hypothetical protein [Microlunatus sp. GCM10028923]|uniref:hypothetical protein n=1 Tax=Microlunatus sp. GCM10028923 TaxID=3273400 RepID=UPI0036193A1E